MATLSGGPITPLVHAHGALFSAWVLLFIMQTALVAQHRVAVHRRLGIAGGVGDAAPCASGVRVGRGTAVGLAAAALGDLRHERMEGMRAVGGGARLNHTALGCLHD